MVVVRGELCPESSTTRGTSKLDSPVWQPARELARYAWPGFLKADPR
jgi:hypothetical protein